MKYLATIFVCLIITSCEKTGKAEHERILRETKEWLIEADPAEDVLKSIEKKDYRFYIVDGHALNVPQVPKKCFDSYEQLEKKTKTIKGTTHSVESYQQANLNPVARKYAKWYNGQMLFYLKDKGKWDCSL